MGWVLGAFLFMTCFLLGRLAEWVASCSPEHLASMAADLTVFLFLALSAANIVAGAAAIARRRLREGAVMLLAPFYTYLALLALNYVYPDIAGLLLSRLGRFLAEIAGM